MIGSSETNGGWQDREWRTQMVDSLTSAFSLRCRWESICFQGILNAGISSRKITNGIPKGPKPNRNNNSSVPLKKIARKFPNNRG